MLHNHQEQSSTGQESPLKTILIVEDDEGIGEYLIDAIKQETPYHAMVVRDSLRAVEVVKHIKPNLLILDYHLPFLTGIELYDQLHIIEGLEHIPAILMSASLPQHAIEKEITERALLSLHSPHELEELIQMLNKVLG